VYSLVGKFSFESFISAITGLDCDLHLLLASISVRSHHPRRIPQTEP
jgi:hypothetical protein